MCRVRGKSRKQTVTSHKDVGSEKEEIFLDSKRRGRPQKPLKDEVEDDEVEKKRSFQAKDCSDCVKEEIGLKTNSVVKDSAKSVGFRQNGSRRKNKPRRAEVGVECN
ncbi:uncharacterized protein LOC130810796 [Amaranthus tricolor]|uniref:uncharacterized protein LOC130810796 n=1 Tax=Amaranthus tricolor TaxID=29722 RepID=UPI002582D0B4|nr:uncharacterized protein LOC130810796 [Amaranthus tricolor]